MYWLHLILVLHVLTVTCTHITYIGCTLDTYYMLLCYCSSYLHCPLVTVCCFQYYAGYRQTRAASVYQAFPTRQVVYRLERQPRGKWARCRDSHTRASHAKHTDDVRVYRASSDKIAPGAIPAAWRLLTAWKSPQCVHVYKNVLEFGYRLVPASVCNRH